MGRRGSRCRRHVPRTRNRVKQAGRDGSKRQDGLTTEEKDELARPLLVKGTRERRLRRRARAARALEEALAEFERMGAKLWAERARTELDRVGGRQPRSPGELTPSERRVAELMAEGLSNKEIAATLFVSVHTVEVHLSHAYAKLGVHSRARLARQLGASR